MNWLDRLLIAFLEKRGYVTTNRVWKMANGSTIVFSPPVTYTPPAEYKPFDHSLYRC